MSKTRNQRRRDRWLRRIATAVLLAIILAALMATAVMWIDLDRRSREMAEREISGPVISARCLPEDWDEWAYRDACQRYYAEQGWVIPQFTAEEGR